MEKQVVNLTIFLMKDHVHEIKDCVKTINRMSSTGLKPIYDLEGIIYYSDSKKQPPRWKSYVDTWGEDNISINDNTSNKAIMVVKVKNRIMVVAFGYGRSLLKEDCIERNFGLKVALNTINQNKMRSVNAATIEDMVVVTQRQASYSTSQDEFGLNITNDIMKGITGEPFDSKYGNHISGKDSLVVSVSMDLSELKEKLTLYLLAYSDDRYKRIGFGWVDNVAEVRDSAIIRSLDSMLTYAIEKCYIDKLHIAPPETTDWDTIIGFCYSGIGKNPTKAENYNLNLDILEYITNIRPESDIYKKIHKDKLYAMNSEGLQFAICSIYAALVFQTEYNGDNYIFYAASWYQVENSFFNRVNSFVQNRIAISNLILPECPRDHDEEKYNIMIANGNDDFCLFDRKMISTIGSPKKIEACDVFTKQKQFIHIKNKTHSAQLSHLFAQGKVSAECFSSDEFFRKQIVDIAINKFVKEPFNYREKPTSNEYEVVYAIIDDKSTDINEKLPFFSKVNLMLTVQELERMHFKCSVCFIKRQK